MMKKLPSILLALVVLGSCVSAGADGVTEEPEKETFNLSDRLVKDGKDKPIEEIWEDRDDIVIGETHFYADDGDIRFQEDADGNKVIYLSYKKVISAFHLDRHEINDMPSVGFVEINELIDTYKIFQKNASFKGIVFYDYAEHEKNCTCDVTTILLEGGLVSAEDMQAFEDYLAREGVTHDNEAE